MTAAPTETAIELRVDEIAQLFHTLDPFPFRERDLDAEAEEFVVGWARELPVHEPIRIVVHFPDTPTQTSAARELGDAFSRHFSHKASAAQRDLMRHHQQCLARPRRQALRDIDKEVFEFA